MKNKNQKKLKNKKYRWGAYGRTTVGGRGCTPLFSAFYIVSTGSEMLNFLCFSESVRKSLYFCNRKRNRKVFKVLWQTGTDGRTDNRRKVVIYIIYIILHVHNITLWNVKLLVRGWMIERYVQSPTMFHVKQYNVKQQPATKKSTKPRWNSARYASKVATTQPTANGWRLEYLQNCNYAIEFSKITGKQQPRI